MQNNLLAIFKAITPDNIKNIPVIDDSIRMFAELLDENSQISIQPNVALSENTTDSIAEELPRIYLYDYYSMIQNLKNNKNIFNKFKNWNEIFSPNLYPIGFPYIRDILYINYFTIGEPGGVLSSDDTPAESPKDLFPFSTKLNLLEKNILQNTAENYYTNRLFKQSKGLVKSIKFMYDVMNEYIVEPEERLELDLQETGNPFELIIKGSLDREIYQESVAYLSHPLGFIYDYDYIVEIKLEDSYFLIKTFKINILEVRCLSGNVEPYSKEVVNIIESSGYIKIIFKDGYYLIQENDAVRYFDNTDDLIKIYPPDNHCSIFVDYEIVYQSDITDNLQFSDNSNFETVANFDIQDVAEFKETLEYKQNFIIGISSIGIELISDDSDQVEVVNYKEEQSFLENNSTDEIYDINAISEEFSIELI
jgi:hypothetical protein